MDVSGIWPCDCQIRFSYNMSDSCWTHADTITASLGNLAATHASFVPVHDAFIQLVTRERHAVHPGELSTELCTSLISVYLSATSLAHSLSSEQRDDVARRLVAVTTSSREALDSFHSVHLDPAHMSREAMAAEMRNHYKRKVQVQDEIAKLASHLSTLQPQSPVSGSSNRVVNSEPFDPTQGMPVWSLCADMHV